MAASRWEHPQCGSQADDGEAAETCNGKDFLGVQIHSRNRRQSISLAVEGHPSASPWSSLWAWSLSPDGKSMEHIFLRIVWLQGRCEVGRVSIPGNALCVQKCAHVLVLSFGEAPRAMRVGILSPPWFLTVSTRSRLRSNRCRLSLHESLSTSVTRQRSSLLQLLLFGTSQQL